VRTPARPAPPGFVGFDGPAAAEMDVHNPCWEDVPAPVRLEVQYGTNPATLDTAAAMVGVPFPNGPLQGVVRCRIEGLMDRAVYHVRSRCVFVFALPEGESTSHSPWSDASVVTSSSLQAAPSLVGFAGDGAPGESSVTVALDNRCVAGVGASTAMVLEVDGEVREVRVEPLGAERVVYVVGGLSPGVEYRVRSRCRVGGGPGVAGEVEQPWSGEVAVRTPARPAPPGFVGFDGPAAAEMDVHNPCWEDVPAPVRLEVQYSVDETGVDDQAPLQLAIPAGAHQDTVRSPHRNTLNFVRSRCVFVVEGRDSFSPWSNWVQHAVPPPVVVFHPGNRLYIVRLGGDVPPQVAPAATGLEVECSSGEAGRGPVDSVRFDGLRDSVQHRFRARVRNEGGVGPWSEWEEPMRHFGDFVSPQLCVCVEHVGRDACVVMSGCGGMRM
jgi:hypothetical protein